MSVEARLRDDLKEALRNKQVERTGALRMLFAAIKNKEIEERKKDVGLGDEEVISVLQKEAKKRKDAIIEFEKAGRADLAKKESEELAVIEEYLPKEISDEEVKRIVREGLRELGSSDKKDFGSLMKIIMPMLKGRASGDRVAKFAREAIASS
ncbi:MAG: GatB/YqeY domain-containing protein [Candidatus Ryanbacteria bacterium]|nr:GatB/YqeY domain-containing protein [Candidatus Ryanbacteria bacterium]